MLNYRLHVMAKGRRKGTSAQLPQIHGSPGAERSYLAIERKMLKEIARVVSKDIVPVVARELAEKRAPKPTVDVDRSVFEMLQNFARGMANVAIVNLDRILRTEAGRHTSQFIASVKRTIGVDVSAVVRQEDLEDVLDNITSRSAGLITNLAEITTRRVQTTITNAVTNSIGVAELQKQLRDDFGFSDNRAKLIARDQIATVNSELNRVRHEQAGVKKYIWRTSRDERVRPRHARLNGKEYEYGESTGAESGLPPGQPIRCRCVAQAIVEF